ncbi:MULTISPECIES: hypothetical protein [unclassified Leptolyngbya]|uniref:hypothetical protein n=1 Tax=unclassified Leptolyngbya TaxID=2650499 RepID=UPI0016859747|nr:MULTISPECIES: hypothetical protein [unclassified Leptolyngbya]MBD1912203.1 hypothetical protein [Leptolyngbya sp. FACHB-8]MBD2155094.1 hypothetical protein [Leptolyngbya sp. FACHB-16]
MKKAFSWVGILLLSLSIWVGFTDTATAQSQTPWFMSLYCQPEGGFLQLNMVPEGASGVTWRGYGTLRNTVINISGRSSYRIESASMLSLPSDPPPAAPVTLTMRSLEEASRGQAQPIGQVALKDIRVYPQEVIGFSGRSNATLLVDDPTATPQLPLSDVITNCQAVNLTTLRRRLSPPNQASYTCYCSNPNLPREMGAESSSGPAFTEWRNRAGEACRVSARVTGTFTCNRL